MLLDGFQPCQFGDPISGSKGIAPLAWIVCRISWATFWQILITMVYCGLLWCIMSRFLWEIRRRTSLHASSLTAGTCCAWAMPTMWKPWHELSWLSGCGTTTAGCEVNETTWGTVWSRSSYHSLPEALKFVGCALFQEFHRGKGLITRCYKLH